MRISGLGSWTRSALISAALLWIFLLFLISNGVWRQDFSGGISSCAELKNQLADVLSELHLLKNENAHLKAQIKEQFKKDDDIKGIHPRDMRLNLNIVGKNSLDETQFGTLYSKEHEVSRRLLQNVVYETFLYLTNYVEKPGNWKNKQNFNALKERIRDQMRFLVAATENFGDKVDNAAVWHRQSLAALTAKIQSTIHQLQNPSDCSTARYMACDLDKSCGFGCQLHHVSYCLLMAAASNRTLLLNKDGADWRYSEHGWNAVFQPISNCSYKTVENIASWEPFNGLDQSAQFVHLPIVDVLGARVEQLPQSFPKQFEDEFLTHHSNPSVFFIAQFLWYLMRENNHMKQVLLTAEQKIPFNKGPVVGLQIRRTDKVGTEASFHFIDEYMKWTEVWFRTQEARQNNAPIKRRVFVATDDPEAVKELKEKYKNYEVYFNDGSAQTAQLTSRYSDASLYAILTDIRMLSKCQYLVCTFSSQVCRMSYELMQVLQGDMAERYHSLDDIYYYGGQLAHDLIATGNYWTNVTGEIELREGDSIGIAGNHWDGFSLGLNRRTSKSGLFPSYLGREKWRIVDFPIFNQHHDNSKKGV